MRERELSELEIGAAFRAFLQDAPTEVRPAVLVDQLARVHQVDRRARPWWSVLAPAAGWSPAFRLAWIVAVVGLLLAATVSAVYVGSQLLRRADELTDVRQPTVMLTFTQPGDMVAVAWSPDGRHLATSSVTVTDWRDWESASWPLRIWDASSGEVILELADAGRLVDRMAYSPDGARLVVGHDGTVYDPTTGEELEKIKEFLAYSPDGTRIAVQDILHQVVSILDAATGEAQLEFPPSPSPEGDGPSAVGDAAWSPDGTRLATGGAGVRVWDATTGDLLLTLVNDGDNPPADIEWSPDGTRIATMNRNWATVWNAVSGERLLTIDQRPTIPLARLFADHTAVSWSPDSTRFATASVDGAATIWDATAGTQVASLTGSRRQVTDVAWSPDGTRIATVSLDGTATIWRVPAAVNEQP